MNLESEVKGTGEINQPPGCLDMQGPLCMQEFYQIGGGAEKILIPFRETFYKMGEMCRILSSVS